MSDKINSILTNGWFKIGLTVVVPVLILTKFSGPNSWGVLPAFLTALALPFMYGGYELYQERKVSFIVVIGLVGVVLTGGIGLLHLSTKWLAVKEAAVPLTIAGAIIVSARTKYSIVETLIKQIINTELVLGRLPNDQAKGGYRRVMRIVTCLIALSFVLSAVLNYILAAWLVRSPAGTEAFNIELGRLTLLSYPIIVLPSMLILVGSVVYLVGGIEKYSGLKLEDIIKK